LYRLERSEETIEAFERARSIALRQDYKRELMMISNTFGSTYLFRSQFDKALKQYFTAYELAHALGDSAYLSSSIHNIGITYYKLKDYRKAIRFFTQAYEIEKEARQPFLMTSLNISLAYANLNNFKNARKHLTETLNECRAGCSENVMMHVKYTSGYIYYGLNENTHAEREFLQSYDYSRKIGHTRMQLDNIYLLAEIYYKRRQSREAISILKDAERLINARASFNLEMIKIYSRFAEVLLNSGDFKEASRYQSKYIHLKDSIYDESLTTGLMATEAAFLERENTAIIKAQKENLALKEEIIVRREVLNLVSALLLIITLTFMTFLFRGYGNKKNANILLNQRIRERTQELEMNRCELLRELKQRDVIMQRTSDGISETHATIEGLCFTAIKDVGDPLAVSYLKKVEKTARRLTNYLPSAKIKGTIT
jgi:tetratricopeptide (TPR) repeat protein